MKVKWGSKSAFYFPSRVSNPLLAKKATRKPAQTSKQTIINKGHGPQPTSIGVPFISTIQICRRKQLIIVGIYLIQLYIDIKFEHLESNNLMTEINKNNKVKFKY